MTLDALIMLCGALVAILPFLGFPSSWDSVLFLIVGVAVVALGIAVRRRGLKPPRERLSRIREGDVFAESAPETDIKSDGVEHERV